MEYLPAPCAGFRGRLRGGCHLCDLVRAGRGETQHLSAYLGLTMAPSGLGG
jgi:hypothetical protein